MQLLRHPLALFLLVLFASPLFADPPKVVVEHTEGKPLTITFPNGREATGIIDRKPVLTLNVPFQVTENLCSDGLNMSGEFHVSVIFHIMLLIWTKHPDPKKINTVVYVVRNSDGGNSKYPAELFAIAGASEREKFPKLVKGMPNDEMVCKDLSWLPGATPTFPATLPIERFDMEGMFTNPQTGLMENRTIGLAMGVDFGKNAQGNLEFKNVKKWVATSSLMLNATLWALIAKDQDGEFCPITLKPNTAVALDIYQKYLTSPSKFSPYLVGEDEYTTTQTPVFLTESYLNTDGNDFE